MDHFEMTEKLREKVNVTYEEAKAALEANDWDLLEAIIYLENHGKEPYAAQEPQAEQPFKERTEQQNRDRKARRTDTVKQVSGVMQGLIGFLTKLVEKGTRNTMQIYHRDNLLLSIPLILVAVILLAGFWIAIPFVIISLFFGIRYRLDGQDISPKVNDAMDSVVDKAEDFKENFQK